MCADRTCQEVYECILDISGATAGYSLGISPTGGLTWLLGGAIVAGDLTTATAGLTITGGTGAVVGLGTIVNYNLITGISSLVAGVQGTLGGITTADTYVGADGLLHLLPSGGGSYPSVLGAQGTLGGVGTANQYAGGDGLLHLLPVAPSIETTSGAAINGATTFTIPATYTNILYVVRDGVVQTEGAGNDYTIAGTTITFTTPFAPSVGGTFSETVLVANLKLT